MKELKWAASTRSEGERIEASGFFDSRWYLEQNPDVRATGRSPSEHYLRYGHREGRNPGPLFDDRWYREQNPDVAGAGRAPLAHFLRAGAGEGRSARSLAVPAPPGRRNVTVEQTLDPSPPGPVAVMVHAYYADVFDDLCRSLRSLRFPFTLLVSTPTEEARTSAVAAIARHRLPGVAQVRVVPNRGRNFAPFVVEFAEPIAAHDYVLHLHTKRSLFTGSDQAHWRDQLVSSLVGSPAVVGAALGLLAAGATTGPQREPVGLVFPTTAPTMPYWAHHWLSNAALAPGLFGRLGVSRYPAGGYFEYPVGGMFWARVDAIRPLLEAGFTYDDFPEEAGQTDGTLAHAIERCFVPLVRSRGHGFVELDKDTGAFQLGWGSRNLDQYRARSADRLHQAIDAADLVSFDLFDTVLTRRAARPDPVIRLAGQRLDQLRPGGDQLRPGGDFFSTRKQAEQAARAARRWTGDVSLPELYAEMVATDGWDDRRGRQAMAMELADDLAANVPRAAVVEAVRHARAAGKRVIAVSDTYFERPHVEQLLEQAGVGGCFDELYLSSERRARKDRGDLWDLVLEQEGVDPGRLLHVGDNERSDVQAADERGIRTYHCMNPTTLLGLRGLRCLDAADPALWGTDLLLGPVVARLANDPFLAGAELEPVAVGDAEELGYAVLGPVVVAFLAWIAQHPALAEVDHLYFLSREGYLLQRLWERFRDGGSPDRGGRDGGGRDGGSRLPPSTYLLTSRRAAMAAAQAVAFDADQVLAGFAFEGTLGDLLASRLGLDLPPGHHFADLRLTLPEDDVVGRKVLNELENLIVDHGAGELGPMLAYLDAIGLVSAHSAAVVDIGYSATIQRHLQTVAGRGLTGFYMGTLAKAGQVQGDGGSAYGAFAEDVPAWTPASPFHRYSILLEALLTAPQGQVERIEVRGGHLAHRFRRDHRTPDQLRTVELAQQGAARYCDDLLGTYGPAILDVPVDREAVFDLVTLTATGAISAPAVTSALVVDDDFCGQPPRIPMPGGGRFVEMPTAAPLPAPGAAA